MTEPTRSRELRLIPLDRIEVLNPRDRNLAGYNAIVQNIKAIGLKKPVTVTPRPAEDGSERYLLVCGEGRLNAFRDLGELRIPALVVAATDEDAFLMSLTENIARRKYRAIELISGIARLKGLGYSPATIAEKTGLSITYVMDIEVLIDRGEERLMVAVQQGRIPINVAILIASAGDDNAAIQEALQGAYESGALRGAQLMETRKLIRNREMFGRSASYRALRREGQVTAASLVRAYQMEVQRQSLMVRRSNVAHEQLLFVAGALRQLISDDSFTTLLRAEGLDTLPKYLSDRVVNAHG